MASIHWNPPIDKQSIESVGAQNFCVRRHNNNGALFTIKKSIHFIITVITRMNERQRRRLHMNISRSRFLLCSPANRYRRSIHDHKQQNVAKKKTIINLIKFASSIDRFVFRCNTTTTPIEIGVEQWIKFVIVIVCWRRRQRKKWYIFLLWCDANAKRNKSKFTCFIVSAEKINRSDS